MAPVTVFALLMSTYSTLPYWASLVAQMVKNLSAMQGDPGSIPGSGRSPGEGNGTHSSVLAWKFHRQRSLVGYSPQGRKASDRTE